MIRLDNVSVHIPVFTTDYARAVRTIIGERLLGGRLTREGGGGRIIVNALRGVSLSVKPGERVGLIGRNGSGKTTLLRVIAGIIPVTAGTVDVKGEVRSFFNLGAGLDVTRSGYANIEPMSLFHTRDRARIRDTTPAIVEFADIGEFIHMPVYTYSAGMQARLLVSIATAYGGDILIFDEMLGAGDEKFIIRLQAKLDQIMDEARCVVVASHSTKLLKRLCDRAIWVHDGQVRADGSVDEVEAAYTASIK
jgi:ABC-type polysaccharide/polyol phosphate transport system ATPase subunit